MKINTLILTHWLNVLANFCAMKNYDYFMQVVTIFRLKSGHHTFRDASFIASCMG